MSKWQLKPSWCGPAAIQNALRARGRRVSQERVARLAGTTDEGSDENDLKKALHSLGCEIKELGTNFPKQARQYLEQFLETCPIMLCVDSWNHWVTITRGPGTRVWLIDPYRDGGRNEAELGHQSLTMSTALRRWKAARRLKPEGYSYYGVVIVDAGK